MHQTTRPLLTSRIQDIRRNRAQIFLLLCVVLWATTFIVMKRGLAVISPGLLIFVRFAAASVVVYACFHRRISWTKLNICKGVAIGLPAFEVRPVAIGAVLGVEPAHLAGLGDQQAG